MYRVRLLKDVKGHPAGFIRHLDNDLGRSLAKSGGWFLVLECDDPTYKGPIEPRRKEPVFIDPETLAKTPAKAKKK